MSIKSTQEISRENCINSIVDIYETIVKEKIKNDLNEKSNQFLAKLLEELNDIVCDGGGFNNYSVCDSPEHDDERYEVYEPQYKNIRSLKDVIGITISLSNKCVSYETASKNILIINDFGIFLNQKENIGNRTLRLSRQVRPDSDWEQRVLAWEFIKTHLYHGECVYLELDKDYISVVIEDLQYVDMVKINSSYVTLQELDDDPIELVSQKLLNSITW